ncbi:complement C1q tumor necrosis factor-related protein 3-like [Littorina saxatilis]|uniref:complement C1q tumor necrosis factor-related protein 3-like n=1 Tax=Littorina saxatilis TaxID=31220 RepID=UPI0038B61F71
MQANLDAASINVAFHAHHSTDPVNVASHGTIVYNVVTTNIGNAYNRNSGYFTAPVSGTYVFFANCMAVASSEEEVYISQDGKKGIAVCYSNRPLASPYEQGSTSVTTHVLKGQKVWTSIVQNSENIRGNLWSTFSGFLVKPDA